MTNPSPSQPQPQTKSNAEREIDRILTLLRNKIRERGFTQLRVQAELGWGLSYISQLVTKQKSLRVEQVLMILDVIGVDPAEFYAELYHFALGEAYPTAQTHPTDTDIFEMPPLSEESRFDEARRLLQGLVQLLLEKGVITDEELTETVASVSRRRRA